jgi:hypothetical protein
MVSALPEASEVGSRRERVEAAHGFAVLSRIREHVSQRVPDRARRRQCAPVPAPREYRASPEYQAIEAPREAHREPAQAAAQRSAILRFDDEMEMIRLHREHDDPKPTPPTLVQVGDRVPQRREHELRA